MSSLLQCCDDALSLVMQFSGIHGPCIRATCRRFAMLEVTQPGAGVAFLYVRRINQLWPGPHRQGLPRHSPPPGIHRLVLLELPRCSCSKCESEPLDSDRYGPTFGRVCPGLANLPGCRDFAYDEPLALRLHGGGAELWDTVGKHMHALAARYPDVTVVLHLGDPDRRFGVAARAAWPGVTVVLAADEFCRYSGTIDVDTFPGYVRRVEYAPPALKEGPFDWGALVPPGPVASAVVRLADFDDTPGTLWLPETPMPGLGELCLYDILPDDAAGLSRAFPALRRVRLHVSEPYADSWSDRRTPRIKERQAAVLRLPHVREYLPWDEDEVSSLDLDASSLDLDLDALCAVGRFRAAAGFAPLAVHERVYKHCDDAAVEAALAGPGLCRFDTVWDDLFGANGILTP